MKDRVQSLLAALYEFLRQQSRNAHYKQSIRLGHLVMGAHSYGSPVVMVYRGSERRVVIGSYCSLAPGVVFITGGIHPADWVSTFPFRSRWHLPGAREDGMPASKGDIRVGNDVWLGTDVMVLSGVTIGHGAIIAARSVVTKDVPPYAIAAGTPARVVGTRFPQDKIDRLLALKWWDWDEERILRAVPLLSSSNVEAFLEAHEKALSASPPSSCQG